MSHNLNTVDGHVSFVSVGATWHGLGQIVQNPLTAEECITKAHLDYNVDKTPVLALVGGQYKEVGNKFVTFREDTGDTFGIVSEQYTIVQNKDAFAFFDSIVGNKDAIYHTAGALKKGEIVFITAKLPDSIVVKGDDIVDKYLLLYMGHNGLIGISAKFTPIRVVCNNTLTAAIQGVETTVKLKHRPNIHDRLKQAHEVLGIVANTSEKVKEIYQRMAKVNISEATLKELIATLTPSQKEEAISTRTDRMRAAMLEWQYTGIGQDLETTKGTVWGFYNGVTGFLDHTKFEQKEEDDKWYALLFGQGAAIRQKAFNLAVELI